jgi:hypothetical protein
MVKVYGVNITEINETDHLMPFRSDFKEDEFVAIAEEQGTVWSLKGFQSYFNANHVPNNLIIYIDINEE